MAEKLEQIEHGWTVVGADQSRIGTVKEIRQDHLVVEQGPLDKHDLFIPVDALADAGDGTVVVNVPAGAAVEEGWRYPPQASYEEPKPILPDVPDTTTMTVAGYTSGPLSSPEAQGVARADPADSRDVSNPNETIDAGSSHPGALAETGEQMGDEPVADDAAVDRPDERPDRS
jgi:hypothetical protein